MILQSDCLVNVESGPVPCVVVVGEVNYESSKYISRTFEQLIQDGLQDFRLDCQSVDFIDSSGIGAIVHAAQMLRRQGGSLKLTAATPQFIHALQISGFADLLDVGEDVFQPPSAARRQVGNTGGWQRSSFSIPVKADTDGTVRRRVTEFAEAMPFTSEQIDDIRLAVGEAVANAVRHGCCDKESDRLTVRCQGDSEKLIVKITAPGEPFDPDAVPIPDPMLLREGGMGIFFMRKSMDQVSFVFDEAGTTVVMTKFLSLDCETNGN